MNGYSCACTAHALGDDCERCAAGFDGAQCEHDVDECGSAPCQNGGACSDGVASYSCGCAAGFCGDSCGDTACVTDSDMLLAFKASGNGNGLGSWNPAAGDPCSGGWAGVTCDGDAGAVVTRLELPADNDDDSPSAFSQLTGDISTLGGLVGLQALDLNQQYHITGALSDLT
eukprot:SAG22_NODE_3364_length_1757_cov_2.051870_2_plen_171_part_01